MQHDLIVIGSGAAGMMAAITAAREGKSVLILEKLSRPGAKLKATGGGRCNLTNTLPNETFMERFGRHGRFMTPALSRFDHRALTRFFEEIGVPTHAPDGFRIFPLTHNAQTILTALENELSRLGVRLLCKQRVEEILVKSGHVTSLYRDRRALRCTSYRRRYRRTGLSDARSPGRWLQDGGGTRTPCNFAAPRDDATLYQRALGRGVPRRYHSQSDPQSRTPKRKI